MNVFGNLKFFIGIVEDIHDPLKLGRVRVRAFGVHPTNKIDVPTEALPWAQMVDGSYGTFSVPPENAWVFGAFLDGNEAQTPIVIGMLKGIPTELPPLDDSSGYGTPTSWTEACDTYSPDISRLARGEEIEKTHVPLTNSTSKEVPKAKTGDEEKDEVEGSTETNSWLTPVSSYNSEYPYNKVMETKAGHVMEFDDTPGAERVNFRHKTGTYIEMDSVGNMKIISSGDTYLISQGNSSTFIEGRNNITIQGKANILAQNDLAIESDGDLSITSHGDLDLNAAGIVSINSGQGFDVKSGRVNIESTASYINLFSATDTRVTSKGSNHFLSSSTNIESGGGLSLKGSKVVSSPFESSNVTSPNFSTGGADSPSSAVSATPSKIKRSSPEAKTPVEVRIEPKIDYGISSEDDEVEA